MRSALLLLVLTAPVAAADPTSRVKVEVSPKVGVWVGQQVTLIITLYTPDLFAGVPTFDVPPIPGVVVLPPAGSPTIGSQVLGDTSFTTQRHEFAVYAQRPGVVRIAAFPIRFETNAGFGKPTVKREVTTEAVSFEARMPPGADGLGTVIAAHDLKVTDEWKQEPKSPKVGDAFTRTLTVTALDLPGMVFPPLRSDAIDGLASYPKDPTVNDRTDRGRLTGLRTDTITFVCERPGTVTIPDQTLTWFDLDAKVLKSVKLPGRTFTVKPDPNSQAGAMPTALTPSQGRSGWWVFVAVGGFIMLAWLVFAKMWPWWQWVRAARPESESAYFARFRHACRSADPHRVYVALLAWLDRFGPMTIDQFTTRTGDPKLTRAIDDLRDRVYARIDTTVTVAWSARPLFVRIEHARCHHFATSYTKVATSLPPLNPSG